MDASNTFIGISMDQDLRSLIISTRKLYNCIYDGDCITDAEVRRRFRDGSYINVLGIPWVLEILQRFVDYGMRFSSPEALTRGELSIVIIGCPS